MENLWTALSKSIQCGGCGRITTVESPHSCKMCGRMLCGACGERCKYHAYQASVSTRMDWTAPRETVDASILRDEPQGIADEAARLGEKIMAGIAKSVSVNGEEIDQDVPVRMVLSSPALDGLRVTAGTEQTITFSVDAVRGFEALRFLVFADDDEMEKALRRYAAKLNWRRRYRKVGWRRLNSDERYQAAWEWVSLGHWDSEILDVWK